MNRWGVVAGETMRSGTLRDVCNSVYLFLGSFSLLSMQQCSMGLMQVPEAAVRSF